MTTQTPLIKKGDPALVYVSHRHSMHQREMYEGTITKISPTGQITVDLGARESGAPHIIRFKPSYNKRAYSEIGAASEGYRSAWKNLAIGADIPRVRNEIIRTNAMAGGGARLRELQEAVAKCRHSDVDALEKATRALSEGIVKFRILQSLPETEAVD